MNDQYLATRFCIVILNALLALALLWPAPARAQKIIIGQIASTPTSSHNAAALALMQKLRTVLPPMYKLSLDEQRLQLNWQQEEAACCAFSAADSVVVANYKLVFEFVALESEAIHKRRYQKNEKALVQLRQLKRKMETFSERQFASSRYSYEPRNAKQRTLLKRCRRLVASLKPLSGYRLDDKTAIALRGDLPTYQVMVQILALLSPLRTSDSLGNETSVYANFWVKDEENPLDYPPNCNPIADYSQQRVLDSRW